MTCTWDIAHAGTSVTLVDGLIRIASGLASGSYSGDFGTYGGATASSLLADSYSPGNNATIAGIQFLGGASTGRVELVFTSPATFVGFFMELDAGGSGYSNYHYTIAVWNGSTYATVYTGLTFPTNKLQAEIFASVLTATKIKVTFTTGDPAPGVCQQAKVGGLGPIGTYGASLSAVMPYGVIRSTLATVGRSTGKKYFEINAPFALGVTVGPNAGLALIGATLNGALGGDANGWAVMSDGHKITNNVMTAGTTGYAATDVIGIYVDLDAGTMGYTINGVDKGSLFTGLAAGTYYPAASLDNNSSLSHVSYVNGRFAAADLLYTPPTGYTAWGVSVPVADFTGTPLLGTESMTVAFTDASTNTPTSRLWNFGDGSTSTDTNPTHTYAPGIYTVTLTATNSAGSDTKTRTNYVVVTTNPRTSSSANRVLAGIRSLAAIDRTNVVASALNKLVKLAVSTIAGSIVPSANVDLAYQPGDVVVIGSNVFTVGDDKHLHKFSTAPAELSSVAVTATRPWIANARGFVLVHAGNGQIATYNTSLVKQSQRTTSLSDVVFAAADSAGNVYAFDGAGYCSLLTVSAAGALTFVQKFAVPDAVGVRSAWVHVSAGKLIIGCAQLARVIVVDTTTLAVDSSTTRVGRQLNSLCINDPAHGAIFEDANATMSPDINLPFNCGIFLNTDSFVLGSSKASTALLYVRTGDVS